SRPVDAPLGGPDPGAAAAREGAGAAPAVVAFPAEPAAIAAQAPPGFRALAPGQTAYARRGGAYVRVAPRPDAELISQLFYDTPLPLLGAVDEGSAPAWYQVELWGVLQGWIQAAEVNVGEAPEPVPAPWERGGG